MQRLLPHQTPCAQAAAADLVRALLLGFTTCLTQLARQADRTSTTKAARQRFARWLDHPGWEPEALYARLARRVACVLRERRVVPLLIDVTALGAGWLVLQVSVPFQGRALPLYRTVRRYAGAAETQAGLLHAALRWLEQHLPGPRGRYVLVMDRGFPSHTLIRTLRAQRWRFVLRVKSNWKLTHPEHTGCLKDLLRACPRPVTHAWQRLLREGVLGSREKGEGTRVRHSQAHVLCWVAPGQQEPWFLLTSETDAALAVALYRERMGIEGEFRDLKGPLGLDGLAAWQDPTRVARFLAWTAVYEWRLAALWLWHHLASLARTLQVKGRLSWIRTVREWIARQLRLAAQPAYNWL